MSPSHSLGMQQKVCMFVVARWVKGNLQLNSKKLGSRPSHMLLFNPIWDVLHKVEASITDKIREFAYVKE